jgi:hypothetical protein
MMGPIRPRCRTISTAFLIVSGISEMHGEVVVEQLNVPERHQA